MSARSSAARNRHRIRAAQAAGIPTLLAALEQIAETGDRASRATARDALAAYQTHITNAIEDVDGT